MDLVGKWVLIVDGTYTSKSGVVHKVFNKTARVNIRCILGYKAIKLKILVLWNGGKNGQNKGGNCTTTKGDRTGQQSRE